MSCGLTENFPRAPPMVVECPVRSQFTTLPVVVFRFRENPSRMLRVAAVCCRVVCRATKAPASTRRGARATAATATAIAAEEHGDVADGHIGDEEDEYGEDAVVDDSDIDDFTGECVVLLLLHARAYLRVGGTLAGEVGLWWWWGVGCLGLSNHP